MEYLYEYLVFLAQAVTVVVAVVALLSVAASFSMRRQQGEAGHLEVRKLNEALDGLRDGVRRAMLEPGQFRKEARKEARRKKKAAKAAARSRSTTATDTSTSAAPASTGTPASGADAPAASTDAADDLESQEAGSRRGRVFVLDFKGDLQASGVKHLRTEITAVLTMATDADEVLVRLESPGGAVHGYGLAASQLDRIRQGGVQLVVAVDKVAASGGYLMAAVADRVLAAPFALVGSIGVIAQIPNVHRLLKKHDVDVEVLTAGKYKRTLTVLGENTDEGRQKFVEELEDVHSLFQEYVAERRPGLDLDAVATGEAWYGKRALDRRLVDEITTSDAYLVDACSTRDVYRVRWVEHKHPIERVLGHLESAVSNTINRITGL